MAKLYPEVFPKPWNSADPECKVFETLKLLSDDYFVFYSQRINGGLFGKNDCEIDFIVFNGRDVVICLEVKGGVLRYDGQVREWMQNERPLGKDIVQQAISGAHTLLDTLKKELHGAYVDWALCFPDCCQATEGLSLNLQSEQVIDERAMVDLPCAIRSLEHSIRFKFGKNRQGLSPGQSHRFVSALCRSIGFVQIIGVRIAREAAQLIQVTNEQLDVLTDLEANPRMLVHGAAGTGKTVIAQEYAKRLAADNKDVLLLFFNKSIAAAVRRAFDRYGNVQVSTFSSFAKRMVEQYDPDWWSRKRQRGVDFWQIELPTKLLDIPESDRPKFGAVIVDEGQDFKPEWFEFMESLLRHKDASEYKVFLDEHQDIFHHWKSFPCKPVPAKKILKKNCRNTRNIVEFLKDQFPVDMLPFERSPSGAEVRFWTVKGAVDEQAQVIRDVKELIQTEQLNPGRIVILINSQFAESSLANTKKIGEFPLESTYRGYDPRAKKVYYSTIDIFKGLEADVVLVILGKKSLSDELAKSIYVQGSRAKHLLYVYERS